MKRSALLFSILILHLSVLAQIPPGRQIQEAKFKIVKATLEFLARDKETFGEIKELTCQGCTDYEELIAYVSRNKIKKADELINKWRAVKVDTTLSNGNRSLHEFKDLVIRDIASGSKSKRKQLAGFLPYKSGLDSVIEEASFSGPDGIAQNTASGTDSTEVISSGSETAFIPKTASDEDSYFNFLPNISKDMYYLIIFLLVTAIAILTWWFNARNQELQNKVRSLQDKLGKAENSAWQSKNVSGELKTVSEKLKAAEKKILLMQQNLTDETERNKRLSAAAEVKKTVPVKVPVTRPSSNPVIKYARYADQGDGFSAQELLDNEDSETIFELTLLTPNSASFKVSGNPNAQRYALSNSPYFLGKTTQYDTFPSGSSLISNDVPGELKLLGNKWQIVRPVQISFN